MWLKAYVQADGPSPGLRVEPKVDTINAYFGIHAIELGKCEEVLPLNIEPNILQLILGQPYWGDIIR